MPNGLSREQLQNAAIIYKVGQSLGASQRDIQIALITALTESNLINVNYGDRDSLGLFQQRAAWAPASVRMDPYQSARMFFLGGRAGQRGLFDFKDRNSMGMGEAAQAVQVSAFPDRYATHLGLVRRTWVDVQRAAGSQVVDMDGRTYGTQPNQPSVAEEILEVTTPDDPTTTAPEFETLGAPEFADSLGAPEFDALKAPELQSTGQEVPEIDPFQAVIGPQTTEQLNEVVGASGAIGKGIDGWRGAVVNLARDVLGTPYVWGGASPNGFDCSGLLQYIYGKVGINLPRVSYQQANSGQRISLNKLQPGDLVAWDNSSRNNGADHIAIYIGNGQIIESPRPGLSVRVRSLGSGEGAWGVRISR